MGAILADQMHRQRVLARVEHTGPERAVGDSAAEMRGELQDIVGGGGRFGMGHNAAALQHQAPVVVGEEALDQRAKGLPPGGRADGAMILA